MSILSLVIPTRNRAGSLYRTLESLHDETASSEHEIFVVDNAPTGSETKELVLSLKRLWPGWNLTYIHEITPGLLAGRHRGALEARGDILIFLDDDVRIHPGWSCAFLEVFKAVDVSLAGGPSVPSFETEPPAWLKAFYWQDEKSSHCPWLSLMDAGSEVMEIDPLLIWGLNFAIRREALFAAGGFHPDNMPRTLQRFQGDGETGLSLKAKELGLRAVYHPRAKVTHHIPSSRLTVEYFFHRAFYQGVCDSYTQIRAHGGLVPPKLRSPTVFSQLKQFLIKQLPSKRQLTEIRAATSKGYNDGYAFHRAEVNRDPFLLEWVLKENYWDYRLPEGSLISRD